jgi:signal transduction histidine kinase
VANVRNCLEVVRRRLDDEKAREFTDLAIDELLRMHELAEQMLDLNRPSDASEKTCDARAVVDQVATLAGLSKESDRWPIAVQGPDRVPVAIPPDTLKQVLLTALANARDASPEGGPIEIRIERQDDADSVATITVPDRGHGIPVDVLPHVFDPFFTTKDEVHGVGLGLFIAQGALRPYGGRMEAENRTPGPGATVRLDVPTPPNGAAT